MSVVELNENIELVDEKATARVVLFQDDKDLLHEAFKDLMGENPLEVLESRYGNIKAHVPYVFNLDSKVLLYKVDLAKLAANNRLDQFEAGEIHLNFLLGSMCESIFSSSLLKRGKDVVAFMASESLEGILTGSGYFAAGLRLRTIKNDLKLERRRKRSDDLASPNVDAVSAEKNVSSQVLDSSKDKENVKKHDEKSKDGRKVDKKENAREGAKENAKEDVSELNLSKMKVKRDGLLSEKALSHSDRLIQALRLTKSLVNTPANLLTPETYEQFCKQICAGLKDAGHPVSIEVYDRSKLENDGAGLILAVGKASSHPPRIIKLSYRPKNPKKMVAFVGKGITYDSGGLNIKPGNAMRHMKKDMGGSAAVFGSFLLAVTNKVNLQIDAYLAVAENMISSNAMRPGDVYVALNGKSVEIDNTDAEGRLVLADALTYASRQNPDVLIDVATLTGAARVALGTQVDACVTNSGALSALIDQSSAKTGDWVWRQPYVKTYESQLDSKVASYENTGGRFGGAITAAMFLSKFHDSKNWIHLDTWMWSDRSNMLAKEAGATPKTILFMEELLKNIENANEDWKIT